MTLSALSASTATYATYQTAGASRAQATAQTPSTQAPTEANVGHDTDADDGGAASIPAGAVSTPAQAQAAYAANSGS
jgi:hypothetical protein